MYLCFKLNYMPDALPDTFIYIVQNRCRVVRWGNWYMSDIVILHIKGKNKLEETLLIFTEYCKIMNVQILATKLTNKFLKEWF